MCLFLVCTKLTNYLHSTENQILFVDQQIMIIQVSVHYIFILRKNETNKTRRKILPYCQRSNFPQTIPCKQKHHHSPKEFQFYDDHYPREKPSPPSRNMGRVDGTGISASALAGNGQFAEVPLLNGFIETWGPFRWLLSRR